MSIPNPGSWFLLGEWKGWNKTSSRWTWTDCSICKNWSEEVFVCSENSREVEQAPRRSHKCTHGQGLRRKAKKTIETVMMHPVRTCWVRNTETLQRPSLKLTTHMNRVWRQYRTVRARSMTGRTTTPSPSCFCNPPTWRTGHYTPSNK